MTSISDVLAAAVAELLDGEGLTGIVIELDGQKFGVVKEYKDAGTVTIIENDDIDTYDHGDALDIEYTEIAIVH